MNGWVVWVVIGGLMAMGGIAAIANPLPATLAAEQIAAWIFLISGIFQVLALFRNLSWSERLWQALLALACMWLGVSLLTNPLAGILALTLVVAIGFAFSGAAKLVLASGMRGTPLFWPFVLSGVFSLVFAGLVLFNLPEMAGIVLGLMLGLELLVSGVTMIALAIRLRADPVRQT